LSDFGDSFFGVGLESLVESLNDDARLTPVGRKVIQEALIGYLVNRLWIRDSIRRIPNIATAPVARPLFIVGLSRTGTTMLHNLLALAPDARAPRTWELIQPAPPCTPNEREAQRRIAMTRRQLRALYFAAPGLRVVHPIHEEDAEECYPLINHSFTSPAFAMHYGVPGYWEWIKGVSSDTTRRAYEEYRSQLQILQYGHPQSRWVLKSAVHLFSLETLLTVFPDALIVQTHRELSHTLPSLCSMVLCFRNVIHATCRPADLGQECLERAHTVLQRGDMARSLISPHQILDVSFDELVRNPVNEVRKIHEHFGLGWSDAFEESIDRWINLHPPHPRGRHRYEPAQFGLDERSIRSRLSV
jgi:hypothetical protein